MSAIVIGIDPGITGALSLFINGRLSDIKDMPVLISTKSRKGAGIRDLIGGKATQERREVDKAALASIIREWSDGHSAMIVREKVGPRPNQGVVSSSRFLEVVGIIDGIAAALSIPVHTVEPQEWKRLTGTPTNKKQACRHAAEVFPMWASQFRRTSIDDDRAESALIGLYGVRHVAANS